MATKPWLWSRRDHRPHLYVDIASTSNKTPLAKRSMRGFKIGFSRLYAMTVCVLLTVKYMYEISKYMSFSTIK